MVSLKQALSRGTAVIAVTTTLFVGSAPAQAHDGRNAALIGGLVVGALLGGALASEAQAYESAPVYRSYYRYPAYESYGYDRYGYVPAHRYRNCDDDYSRSSGWDDDDD